MGDIKSVKTRDINNPIQSNDRESHATSNTDWWPMFRHDSGNTACSSSIAPNTNQLCWKETISDMIYQATPIIYNNRLYMSTGWFYKSLEPPTIMDKSMFEPPDFTEILNDYFTYNEDYYGGIYCLDANTGTELWNYPLYLPNDPLIVEKKVYLTDLDIYTATSSLYCFNSEAGDLIWKQPVGTAVLRPTIGADSKIFLGCIDYFTYTGSLKCYDFDGNSLWTYPFPTNELIGAAPAYYEGKVYFITFDWQSQQGRLYCVNAENGNDIWDVPIYSYGSPACKDSIVFAVDFNFSYNPYSKLMCFDADTGSLLCEYRLEGNSMVWKTPAVSQDSVFIEAFDLNTESSWLYKIFINCTLDWKVMIPISEFPFSTSPPICSANKIFICPWSYYGLESTIYCMEIENGNILWNYTLDYESETYPSIANERVYIADIFGNIYAFGDPGEPPTPPIIDGPSKGSDGKEICWTFNSSDADGDMVKYYINWGDNSSNETDFNPPCEPVEVCHTYEEQEEYTITATAEDVKGLVSEESSFKVTIPRPRAVFHPLLLRLFERFPYLFPIFRCILGL
jgi:outer membrane protein assembly factor BamB